MSPVAILITMQVALLHSITMGGGAGVSIPGTFRLATEKTVRTWIRVYVIPFAIVRNYWILPIVQIFPFSLGEESIF